MAMRIPPKTMALGISFPGFCISEAKVVTTSKPRKLNKITERFDRLSTLRLGSSDRGVNTLAGPRVTAA